MKLRTLAGLAFLFYLGASPSLANFIPPMSLESQRSLADLVVIGRLGNRTTCQAEGQRFPCAEIQVDVVLKGSPASPGIPRYLILSSPIMEASIEGMDLSGTVLMFLGGRSHAATIDLMTTRAEYFWPVHAGRSIFRIDDSNNR
jgi:hypothetical protein